MLTDYLKKVRKALKPVYSDYIITRDGSGNIKKLVINSSLLGRLFFSGNIYDKNSLADYCPKKLRHVYMKGISTKTNIYQERGLYFEKKVLGSSAGQNDVNELPLTSRGKKSAPHERIDEQIKMFPQLCDKLGIIVTNENVQVEKYVQLESNYDFEVFIKAKLDLVTPLEYEGITYDAAVVDLKLTGDIEKGYWSRYVDTTQGQLYSLVTNLPFFYWVFDYSTYMRNKLIRVITKTYHKPNEKNEALIRDAELKEKIRKTIELIMDHEINGYPANANQRECKDCPLNPDHGGNCEVATQETVM